MQISLSSEFLAQETLPFLILVLTNQFLHSQVSCLVAFLEVPITDTESALLGSALNVMDSQICLSV